MNKKGFSLTELMIVVALIGIIAAIAVPSYNSYMQRTRRSEAISALETLALYEEKHFAEFGRYNTIAGLAAVGYIDPNGMERNYQIAVNPNPSWAEGFLATATGMNKQLNDKDSNGVVITPALDQTGNHGRFIGGALVSNNNFWKSLRP
jgi:type IV pilus assembly protein PilE